MPIDRKSRHHEPGLQTSPVTRYLGGAVVIGAALTLIISSIFFIAGIAGMVNVYYTFKENRVPLFFFDFFIYFEVGLPLLALIIGFTELLPNIQPFIAGLLRLFGKRHNAWGCMIVIGTLVNVVLAGLFFWLTSIYFVFFRPRIYNLVFPLIFLLPEFFKHLGFWLIHRERKKIEGALAPVLE